MNLTFTNDNQIAPGGDVGGDIQWTDSLARRWWAKLPNDTWIVVTSYVYGATDFPLNSEAALRDRRIDGQVQVIICTDPSAPGDTELSSVAFYEDDFAMFDDEPAVMDMAAVNRNLKAAARSFDPIRDFPEVEEYIDELLKEPS